MTLVRLDNGFKYECQRSKGGADGRKDGGRNRAAISLVVAPVSVGSRSVTGCNEFGGGLGHLICRRYC